MGSCYHLLEWYLKDGFRYRCTLCGRLLKIASGRYPTVPSLSTKPASLDNVWVSASFANLASAIQPALGWGRFIFNQKRAEPPAWLRRPFKLSALDSTVIGSQTEGVKGNRRVAAGKHNGN